MPTESETRDGKTLDQAIQLLSSGDARRALPLLEQVAVGSPDRYVRSYERDGALVIKFWGMDEFLAYIACQENRDRNIVWEMSVYPRACYYLGFARLELGDAAGAIAALDQALELEPDHPAVFCEKGYILGSLGRYEEALALYRHAAVCRKTATPKQLAVALRGQGLMLIEMGDLDAAEERFQKSLTLDPDSATAHNELRYIQHLRAGGPRAATETVRTTPPVGGTCACCHGPLGQDARLHPEMGQLVYLCDGCYQKATR